MKGEDVDSEPVCLIERQEVGKPCVGGWSHAVDIAVVTWLVCKFTYAAIQ